MRYPVLSVAIAVLVGGALTISAAAVGLGGQKRPQLSAKPAAGASGRVDVNRARKGDRLPAVAPARAVQQPATSKRVPVGCEPAISPLARPKSNFPGFCVS